MEGLSSLISMFEFMVDTRRKRHITGGVLLSISMLFTGLAFTAMTIKQEEEESENEVY